MKFYFINFIKSSQSEIIIDMLSVERNFVLVNANLIGGPNEKRLPSRSLSENVS